MKLKQEKHDIKISAYAMEQNQQNKTNEGNGNKMEMNKQKHYIHKF